MFLEQQISILELLEFLKSHVTEDWSNGYWKFSFVITGINYISKYIKIESRYFKFYIWKYYGDFWSNKCIKH